MKTCSKCGETKALELFKKSKQCKDGLSSWCKACHAAEGRTRYAADPDPKKEKNSKWSKANPEHHKALQRSWYYSNKDEQNKKSRDYNVKNRDRLRAYDKQKQIDEPSYKISKVLRSRLGVAIKGNQKSGSAVSDLGCTIDQLKQHLESQFLPGMTWDNWGKEGWHIDHIRPLASFDLTDREQFLQACNFTNLQPLWAKDNLTKGAKQ